MGSFSQGLSQDGDGPLSKLQNTDTVLGGPSI